MNALRILHVGTGFRLWRRGGLIAYVEDLTAEQAKAGHEVTYLFSGRHYPGIAGPRLRRWTRHGVAMVEIVNSPLFDHGHQPELEVGEPQTERIVAREIAAKRPDVVHVQELAGLPSSVLDVARAAGVPVVMTLQDYFPLCPSFKLVDAAGRTCLRREIGADCVATTARDPHGPDWLVDATLRHDMHKRQVVHALPKGVREPLVAAAAAGMSRGVRARTDHRHRPFDQRAAAFQRRRNVNVARLNDVDRLIAMSTRVAEIYATLGVDPARLTTMQLTLGHIEQLTPRTASGGHPVTFGTLGGGESEQKGARLLLDAARALNDMVAPDSFRLLLLGHVAPEFVAEAGEIPGVELGDWYPAGELDALLDGVDVGLMPSVWEEAYGYAGVEFLAKGIPVISNAIGGMTDYTVAGQTGWVNRDCSAGGLAAIMRDVVERPQQVVALNRRLRAERDAIIKPMAHHVQEMEQVYRELIARRE